MDVKCQVFDKVLLILHFAIIFEFVLEYFVFIIFKQFFNFIIPTRNNFNQSFFPLIVPNRKHVIVTGEGQVNILSIITNLNLN